MNITKLFTRTSAALAAAAMAASMTAVSFTASAENEAVKGDRSGIVQVEAYYHPSKDEKVVVQTGSGFLINEDTFVTCYHVTDVSDSIKDIEEYYTFINDKKHEFDEDYVGIQVAVLGDVKMEAELITESEAGDFAIYKLKDKLTTKKPLVICDSDYVNQTDSVYALGYPSNVTNFQKQLSYLAYKDDDVTITQGNVSKTKYVHQEMPNFTLIQHSAYLSGGNSGGPLVNEQGYVVGMANASSLWDNDYNYAIEFNQIKDLLDTLDIDYTACPCHPGDGPKPTDPDSETTTAPETDNPNPDTTAPTQPTTVAPITTTELPESDPKPTPWVLIGILGAAAVIVIILIIILVVKGGKKPEPVPAAPAPVPPRPPINPTPANRPISPSPMGGMDNGAGETSLLNAGAGETSILGGGAAVSRVTIIRKKTGTSIPVNAPEFIIGKENNRVNYCVNNNAVSRQHAKISVSNGSYFITDMNSSNFTYLNGRKLPANTPQPLHSGDIFKLADEEFEFRG